jgi:hypothetical protein
MIDYETRSQQIADSLRTHLVAFNTGGIGIGLATAASLAAQCVKPNWITPATASFVVGLLLVIGSLFLQKHKALKRRDAACAEKAKPDFTGFLWRNFTWDILSFAAFTIGAVLALCALGSVSPGCGS